jgi:hypothetical protein
MSHGGKRIVLDVFGGDREIKIPCIKSYDWRDKEGIQIKIFKHFEGRPTAILIDLTDAFAKIGWINSENIMTFIKNLIDIGFSCKLLNERSIEKIVEFGIDREYWDNFNVINSALAYFLLDKQYSKEQRIREWIEKLKKEMEDNNGKKREESIPG